MTGSGFYFIKQIRELINHFINCIFSEAVIDPGSLNTAMDKSGQLKFFEVLGDR